MNFVVHRSGGLSFHLFWFLQCIGIPLQWYQNHSSSSSLVWNEGWEDLMMVGLLFFPKTKKEERKKILTKVLITLRIALTLSFPFFSVPVVFLNRVGFLSIHQRTRTKFIKVDCLQIAPEGSKHEWDKFKLIHLTFKAFSCLL